jgi:hypothetical protein
MIKVKCTGCGKEFEIKKGRYTSRHREIMVFIIVKNLVFTHILPNFHSDILWIKVNLVINGNMI